MIQILQEEYKKKCYNSDIRIATKKGAKQNSIDVTKIY